MSNPAPDPAPSPSTRIHEAACIAVEAASFFLCIGAVLALLAL